MLVSFICWLLSKKSLKTDSRMKLTNQILRSIDALPLHSIIKVHEGKIFIRDVPVENEKAIVLRESADSALHNYALQTVHEQVLYEAVSYGVHLSQNIEQIQFAKAAIWYAQKERELLQTLSTGSHTNSSFNGD